MKSNDVMIKLHQPCVIVDQPLRNAVQGTQQSLRLKRNIREKDVQIELKLLTVQKLSL